MNATFITHADINAARQLNIDTPPSNPINNEERVYDPVYNGPPGREYDGGFSNGLFAY